MFYLCLPGLQGRTTLNKLFHALAALPLPADTQYMLIEQMNDGSDLRRANHRNGCVGGKEKPDDKGLKTDGQGGRRRNKCKHIFKT